ncbi:MAG: CocE/NonD family hydrolase [Sulfurimonas sp.]
MNRVTSLPYRVKEIEHLLIPLPDGSSLAAKIWLPEDAEKNPVPAIFEYIPYRKRDLTRARDSITHTYLASHGYACVRVDLRGSGESDGTLKDQYRQQELDDGIEAIRWIAKQSWCDGNVGMMGISWGGFNSLQIAAMKPPELKAIITVCSTDDLFVDNMHYMGGCLLTDNLSESTTMFSVNTCPPDPELVGERWREMWLQRLKESGLWLDIWLRHQRRDAYWKHGSISEDYSTIECPVMTVGGWADGYTNAVFRLLSHLDVPRLGLVGPWGHKYPHLGIPGPAIGFLQEALRWWDKWLKGKETGIMEEPMIRAWMQDSVPPTTYYHERPGHWVGEKNWPSPEIHARAYPLSSGRIETRDKEMAQEELTIQSPLSVGLFAGKWCSYSYAPDLPHDQREEDGGALVFDTDPLKSDIEILGAPAVELEFASDKPVAMAAVRLSSIAPDDKVTRATYGVFNLCYSQCQASFTQDIDPCELPNQMISSNFHMRYTDPEKLIPKKRYKAWVQLNNIAQIFPKGHRMRISISTSYWPLAWAPPEPVRLSIFTGSSRLILPERTPKETDRSIRFKAPEGVRPIDITAIKPSQHNWIVHRDPAEDISALEVIKDEGVYAVDDIDMEVTDRTYDWYTYQGDDFASLRGETETERRFKRGNWSVRTTTRTILTCDQSHFYIHATLDAYEGEKRIYSQNWDRTIPRDHV